MASTDQHPPARSFLFVPGDRPERFAKAWDSLSDEVIIDLEDAVTPDKKAFARESLRSWLAPEKPVWIRINAMDTPWCEEDLSLMATPGVRGVMLPKAETIPQPVLAVCKVHALPLLPIIESAWGMQNVDEIARTSGVNRLSFGALDFQVDLGIPGDDDALLYFRSRLVLASRLAGLPPPVDGVTPDIRDAVALRSDVSRSKRLGFGAKLCIHPNQIEEVHDAFSPSTEEVQWAQRVVLAMKASEGAAVALDGKMIDRPVWLKAQRIVAAPAADHRLRL